jgi:carboxymethylenebutenolidase
MATRSIETLDHQQSFDAYWAEPASGEAPVAGIIVIQEIFGVNEGIRRKCDHWASLGYVAAAPDLFWRFAPGVELDPDVPEQFQQALELMGKLDQDLAVRDIEATIRALRARIGSAAKIGVVGYCLGGRLAYMAATRTDADASVGYYGVGLDGLLHEQNAIGKPLLLHIAGDDHFVPPAAQRAIHEGLDGNPHVTLRDYPGEDHGFAAETGARRSEEAARLADSRTEAFFAQHLRG